MRMGPYIPLKYVIIMQRYGESGNRISAEFYWIMNRWVKTADLGVAKNIETWKLLVSQSYNLYAVAKH